MTINAYLIKKINLDITNDEIIIEKTLKKTPSFKLNNKILEILQKYKLDNTTEDLNGEIVIDRITWQQMLNELSNKIKTKNELKIIEKINNDLENKEIIYYECF